MAEIIYLTEEKGFKMRGITIFDVADTFLVFESMTHKKLQKLCYYAQAWHLALYNEKLFDSDFEAWVHGPVCPELYQQYKGYGWNPISQKTETPNIIKKLNKKEFLETVYKTYGEFSGDELEWLTHEEAPWQEARKGLEEWEPSHNIISKESMKQFYWRLYEQSQND